MVTAEEVIPPPFLFPLSHPSFPYFSTPSPFFSSFFYSTLVCFYHGTPQAQRREGKSSISSCFARLPRFVVHRQSDRRGFFDKRSHTHTRPHACARAHTHTPHAPHPQMNILRLYDGRRTNLIAAWMLDVLDLAHREGFVGHTRKLSVCLFFSLPVSLPLYFL